MLTAKSQQASADASVVSATASLSALTGLQNAQMTNDLALATALKSSGLSAATGKEGNITIASADKALLALQRGSLVAIDQLAKQVCDDLTTHGVTQVFLAPTNFEMLVEKSVPDVVQLNSLNLAATAGKREFGTVQMQVAGTAVAGALISAQYLAGGIQALTKLFRSDYGIAFTTNNRVGLVEQRIAATCGPAIVDFGVESQLRLRAATILTSGITNIASFAQLYDEWNEQTSAEVNSYLAKKAAISADNAMDAQEKSGAIALIGNALTVLAAKQKVLAKYKNVVATMKTYLTGLTAQSPIFDSVVWGQEYLITEGGWPDTIPNPKLSEKARLVLVTNTQDAAVTKSSTFFANTIKGVSTVEAYYSVVGKDGKLVLSGVYSQTSQTPAMDFSNPTLAGYSSSLPSKPVNPTPKVDAAAAQAQQ
ncbi:MAG: hypothetical protein U1F64_01325 [Burkholderiales bacterium]